MSPLVVSSREYKLMLDHRLFADRRNALASFLREVEALSRQHDVRLKDGLEKPVKRELAFLDTLDFTIALNGLVFRQRVDHSEDITEYTLKCRSPDRYVASGAAVTPADPNADVKLEEDISAPFEVRFSHSGTVCGGNEAPSSLGAATEVFPGLRKLRRDGQRCDPNIKLLVVKALKAFERVYKGPEFRIGDEKAEVAVILWSDGENGRPFVAEFSFRYKDKEEKYSAETARIAKELFEALQRLDWFLPHGRTKTQFAYGT